MSAKINTQNIEKEIKSSQPSLVQSTSKKEIDLLKDEIAVLALAQDSNGLFSYTKPSLKNYVKSKVLLLSEICINFIISNFESIISFNEFL